jgi:Asp/Glu/hydantoin racemase
MAVRRAALVNPNTDPLITARMRATAAAAADGRLTFMGYTARFGAPLITTAGELRRAAEAVEALAPDLARDASGIIVSAFGDPGAAVLRQLTGLPVVGIGEASLREGATAGRRFCVATTTPGLVATIDARVAELGLAANYAGVVLTSGDPAAITSDPSRLEAGLAAAISRAIAELGVEAVVIGGGPLSDAARQLAKQCAVAIVEPVPAAVRQLLAAIES